MRQSKRIALTLVLATAVVLAGCSGTGGHGTDPPGDGPGSSLDASSADAVREQTIGAMESVESYSFEMTMSIGASGQTINMTSTGAIDLANERMRQRLSLQGPFPVNTTQYVVNDTLYLNSSGQWTKRSVDQPIWNRSQLSTQQEVLEGEVNLTLAGEATVDGEEVVVLEARPDGEALLEAVRQQQGTGGQLPDGTAVSNVTVTQYVSEETSLVKRMEMSMEMTTQGQTVSMTMTMTFDDYNEPVEIELPPEAEDATTMSGSTASVAPAV